MTRPARSASFSYVGQRLTTTYNSFCNRMSIRRHKQRMNNLEASVHVLQSQLADLLSSNAALKASIATLTTQVHNQHTDSLHNQHTNSLHHKHKRPCFLSPRARQIVTLPSNPPQDKPCPTEDLPEDLPEDLLNVDLPNVDLPNVGLANATKASESAEAETAEWFTLTSGSVRSL